MFSIKEVFKIGYGPSSSHTIAPFRAAEIFYKKNRDIKKFKVSLFGSLAATGIGHGTLYAIQNGMPNADISFNVYPDKFLPKHPNGMIFEAIDSTENIIDKWEVYSVGGGELQDFGVIIPEKKEIYPHQYLSEILQYCFSEGITLWEYVEKYEDSTIWSYLDSIWKTMKESIRAGLENEGVLPGPLKIGRKASSYIAKSKNSRGLIGEMGTLFSYALAVSEENAAGRKVVTSPTCGSSGVLPAILYFLDVDQKVTTTKIVRGLATAGLIGNIIKTNASISGAEVGCQGEIGSACSMASAACAQIMGGTPFQIEYAAEMGLEHHLGLTCDPIYGYVQIPCIERNAIAASKSLDCAVYALFSDGKHKIPFDMAVKTMGETGKDLQSSYKETGWGGLARYFRESNDNS
ncbi:L-serine ammonia-lyase [bacterium]|nr:L-serine ammonia-lyase [bacterium]